VQRSSAAQLKEHEPLFTTYEHLAGLDRGDAALALLRKVASVVKPLMRKRNWRVQVLAEFLPPEQNLLGLNINKGHKICIRLRYHNNPDLFLPFEDIVDTLLHELAHNVWGPHDSNFHKLWDELRDEHETLLRKGYTGEGFLGSGKRLGGAYGGIYAPPAHEMRQRARASAEKRNAQGALPSGPGQRLGGTPLHRGQDIRKVIADQASRRNTVDRGCASGRGDAGQLSDQASSNTFKTKAEEDDANNRAIAQALFIMMEQEEAEKLNGTFQEKSYFGGLEWSPENGLYSAGLSMPTNGNQPSQPSEDEQLRWAMEQSLRGSSGRSGMQGPSPATVNDMSSGKQDQLSHSPEDTTAPKRKRPDANLSPSPPALGKSPRRDTSTPAQEIRNPSPLPRSLDPDEAQSPAVPDAIPEQWTCDICTCINPFQFLACDACGIERPQTVLVNAASSSTKPTRPQKKTPAANSSKILTTRGGFQVKPPDPTASLGWSCVACGSFMEHKWWTCSACGQLKNSS
jgi:hypothetical protein